LSAPFLRSRMSSSGSPTRAASNSPIPTRFASCTSGRTRYRSRSRGQFLGRYPVLGRAHRRRSVPDAARAGARVASTRRRAHALEHKNPRERTRTPELGSASAVTSARTDEDRGRDRRAARTDTALVHAGTEARACVLCRQVVSERFRRVRPAPGQRPTAAKRGRLPRAAGFFFPRFGRCERRLKLARRSTRCDRTLLHH
jgi:hypothetical protein